MAGIIHDDMLQSMIAAKMRMFLLHRDGEADEATAASIESSIEGAIVRMRTMLSDLHPHILELGLRAAVEQSISEFNDGEDLVVILTDEVSGEPSPIVATTLYRIIREALTNARSTRAARPYGVLER